MSLKRLFLAALAALSLAAPLAAHAADLTVTAASVVAGSDAVTKAGTAGEALTAGQPVYLSATTNKWLKADCNSATAAARVASGIALNGGAANQPVVVQTGGTITIGATLTAGVAYYLSGTAGGIRPVADNTTGDYPQVIGIATSTTVLKLNFTLAAGVAL